MTTRLAGKETLFLPFNQGTSEGGGVESASRQRGPQRDACADVALTG